MPTQLQRTALTKKKRKMFHDALSEGYPVTQAAAKAGYSRRYVYDIRDANPEFAADWDDAWEQGADRLRAEVLERALKGTKESTGSVIRSGA
jgi:hypothetical protein